MVLFTKARIIKGKNNGFPAARCYQEEKTFLKYMCLLDYNSHRLSKMFIAIFQNTLCVSL